MIIEREKGFTFLELLIALGLFSIGLLGVLQLQYWAQRQLQEAIYVNRAFEQAYNFSALLQMFSAKPMSALSQTLQQQWNEENAQVLPNGYGELIPQGNGAFIKVYWQSPVQSAQIQLYDARASG